MITILFEILSNMLSLSAMLNVSYELSASHHLVGQPFKRIQEGRLQYHQCYPLSHIFPCILFRLST